MKQLYFKALGIFKALQNKIIFYPTLFALAGVLIALIMMYLENLGISRYLLDHLPVLVVDNGDTALAIMSAIITGLISMMVFSFSMVMLLLSQASSDYSPRLLPGLISVKSHQIILGIYLGTILYCIFILFSIQPGEDKFQIPGFSVLLGIFFTVVCIYAFIYFIHNISQNIQITHILDRVYLDAKKNILSLIELEEKQREVSFPSTSDWFEHKSDKSGYLQGVSLSNLLDICEENDIQLHILPVKGVFVLHGIPLFKTDRELKKKTLDDIISNFNFSRGELVSENYVLAFKQITEIIVKAMSPGINDPGTALNGIDYLTELFALRLHKGDGSIITRDEKAYINFNTVSFDELIYNVLASIRTYCKQDIVLVQKLMLMFHYLKMQNEGNKKHLKSIELEAKTLVGDAMGAITNQRDQALILKLADKMGLYIHEK